MRWSFLERGASQRSAKSGGMRKGGGTARVTVSAVKSWNGRGQGRIGANVDSNPSPRWAIDRKIYLDEVDGADHTHPTYPHSTPPLSLSLSLAHAPPATFSRKSLRLTFRPSSDRGIKFGREAVSNILCSSSATLWLRRTVFHPLAQRPAILTTCDPAV